MALPSFDQVRDSKEAYAESFSVQYRNTDPFTAKPLIEDYGTRGYVIQNPPALPLSTQEMDDVYDLPYMGTWASDVRQSGGDSGSG